MRRPRLVAREAFRETVDAPLDRFAQRQLLPVAQQRLLEPDRLGRGRADHVHRARDRIVEPALGGERVDEAPVMRPVGPDGLPGIDEPGRAAPADQPREQRRLYDGGDADLDLGHAELRRPVRDPEIAGRRDFQPRAQTVARHAPDHRDRREADRAAQIVDRGDERADRLGRKVDHGADVRPADERALARAAQHDDPHVAAFSGFPDSGAQRAGAIAVDDVELVGIVVADGRDPPAAGAVLGLRSDRAQGTRSLCPSVSR